MNTKLIKLLPKGYLLYMDLVKDIYPQMVGNIYWKDKQGRYLGCNEGFAKICGLSNSSEIIGKTDQDFIKNKVHLKTILSIDQSVIESGEEKTVEEIGLDPLGNVALYITKKAPLKDKNNQVIGLIGTSINVTGTSIDITKQRQAELAKLEFLRNMSHDIMTPFTGILGISNILYEEESDPAKKIHLEYLIQSGERLLQLFKQILEISEFGNKELKIEEFNIKEVITETVTMVAASARHKGLELKINCPNQIIKSDKLRVERILLNLLGNAIKFTDSGHIDVNVVCEPKFTFTVEDTGIGIPADKLEIIFEKFSKLSESGNHRNFMGSGIGLYIAKQFAMELGGDIDIQSKVGEGSKFIFYMIR